MSSSLANEFVPSDDHAAIREGVRSVVTRFGDDYWLARDDDDRAYRKSVPAVLMMQSTRSGGR